MLYEKYRLKVYGCFQKKKISIRNIAWLLIKKLLKLLEWNRIVNITEKYIGISNVWLKYKLILKKKIKRIIVYFLNFISHRLISMIIDFIMAYYQCRSFKV